jgi:hypothetical protein
LEDDEEDPDYKATEEEIGNDVSASVEDQCHPDDGS